MSVQPRKFARAPLLLLLSVLNHEVQRWGVLKCHIFMPSFVRIGQLFKRIKYVEV